MLSLFSCVQLSAALWTVAHQALLSMGFSSQEYWNGLPCPPPGDLPDPAIEPVSLMSPALTGGFVTTSITWEVLARPHCCSVAKLHLTLHNPMDCSTPGSFVPHHPPRVCSSSLPVHWWCHPTISSSIALFSFCFQSFPEPSGLHFPGWLVIWCSAGLSNGRLEGDGRGVRFPSLHLLRQQLTLFSGSFFSEALRTQLPLGICSWGQQAFSSFAPGSGRSLGKGMPSFSCYHPLG